MALSRLGVYIRVPGVDVAKFEQSMQGGGLLGYIDALSGGSISKVGVFSLGESASILVHGLSGCICEHMVDHMLARWTTVGLSCSDHLEASVDDSCHILLAVLAEFALNMRVLLQSWLFVLQYAKTASWPMLSYFTMHVCLQSRLHWLEHANTPFGLVCFAPCYSASNAFVLSGLACTCRRCTHAYDATLADRSCSAAAVQLPSSYTELCCLQESCLTSMPPSFCSC